VIKIRIGNCEVELHRAKTMIDIQSRRLIWYQNILYKIGKVTELSKRKKEVPWVGRAPGDCRE
jgi:hypothetical protein